MTTKPAAKRKVQIRLVTPLSTPLAIASPDGKPVTRSGGRLTKAETAEVFARAGGSKHPTFNRALFDRVMDTAWRQPGKEGAFQEIANVAYSALAAFKPVDEIEGMLAAQAVAMHLASMECFRRAMLVEQPFEMAGKMRKDGVNLARGMADMLEALDRKRGKGHQVVRVERVIVHEGGQAVVGCVAPALGRGGI